AAAEDLAVRSGGREVKVWEVATGRELASFRPAGSAYLNLKDVVALSSDGKWVAFDECTTNGPLPEARVRGCSVSGGRDLVALPAGTQMTWALAFSPDGRRLAAAGDGGAIRVWDTAAWETVFAREQDRPAFRLAFHPDGRHLAAVDRERVRVWDVPSG